MVFSLLLSLLAPSRAAEMETLRAWSLGAEGFAEYSIAAGDFDGDGLADVAVPAGEQDVVLLHLSTRPEELIYFITADQDSIFTMSVADWDGDGEDELLLGLPGYPVTTPELITAGAVFVLDPEDAVAAEPVTAESIALYSIYGDEDLAWFGASLAAADLSGDGLPELMVGAPGAVGGDGVVYTFPNSTGDAVLSDALGRWSGETGIPGVGAGLLVLPDQDADGLKELAIAACPGVELDLRTCAAAPQIAVQSGAEGFSDTTLSAGDGVVVSLDVWELPRSLISLPDLDADGADEVLWSASGIHRVIEPTVSAPGLGALLTDYGDGAAAWVDDLSGDGLPDLMMDSGANAAAVDSVAVGGSIEGLAFEYWNVKGYEAGSRLLTADLNGDGCMDILSTAEDPMDGRNIDTLYAVYAPCEITSDTGDTGDTGGPGDTGDTADTGDPGDSGSDTADTGGGSKGDSGDSGDTGVDDSGSDGGDDTGGERDTGILTVCREFGWSCGGSGQSALLWGAALLLLLRRRR